MDRVETAEGADELVQRRERISLHENRRQLGQAPSLGQMIEGALYQRLFRSEPVVDSHTGDSRATASIENRFPLTRTSREAARIFARVESINA